VPHHLPAHCDVALLRCFLIYICGLSKRLEGGGAGDRAKTPGKMWRTSQFFGGSGEIAGGIHRKSGAVEFSPTGLPCGADRWAW
jgi:hypothetical protein